MSTNRVTAKQVHGALQDLKVQLILAEMLTAADTWNVEEGSATYGRPWKLHRSRNNGLLPYYLAQQLGWSSGFLGDTAREALETVRGAQRMASAIAETRCEVWEHARSATLEQLAASGCVAASLTLSLMDDGFTYTDALAAATALAVSQ